MTIYNYIFTESSRRIKSICENGNEVNDAQSGQKRAARSEFIYDVRLVSAVGVLRACAFHTRAAIGTRAPHRAASVPASGYCYGG